MTRAEILLRMVEKYPGFKNDAIKIVQLWRSTELSRIDLAMSMGVSPDDYIPFGDEELSNEEAIRFEKIMGCQTLDDAEEFCGRFLGGESE